MTQLVFNFSFYKDQLKKITKHSNFKINNNFGEKVKKHQTKTKLTITLSSRLFQRFLEMN